MQILIVDNYDSFTYNLVHMVEQFADIVDVVRNDALSPETPDIYDGIILSPGPGLPRDAGCMMSIIKKYSKNKPILGVCLGHQAIGESFGAKLINLPTVFHGKKMPIYITNTESILFNGVPKSFNVGRYHSWVIDKDNLPTCLQTEAVDSYGNIMALKHKDLKIFGVQFHPESVMTEHGISMLKNWISHILD